MERGDRVSDRRDAYGPAVGAGARAGGPARAPALRRLDQSNDQGRVTVAVSVTPLYASNPTSRMYHSPATGLARSHSSLLSRPSESQSSSVLLSVGGVPRLTYMSTS